MTMSDRWTGSSRRNACSSASRSASGSDESVDPRMVEVGQLHLDDPAPGVAHLVDARADDEPAEPGVEAIGVAERGQVPPGARERLLDGVLGPFGIAGDHAGDGIEARDRGGRQAREGVAIASPRPDHEIPIHRRPARRRGLVPRSHGMAGVQRARFRNSRRSMLTAACLTLAWPATRARRRGRAGSGRSARGGGGSLADRLVAAGARLEDPLPHRQARAAGAGARGRGRPAGPRRRATRRSPRTGPVTRPPSRPERREHALAPSTPASRA